ncbi:MAG: CerR family C-terminal domain-containing protein [Planctomycetes bacterium]|nr:CerR family C-terminal domain-containing protein [Planctomycetota bacterium]
MDGVREKIIDSAGRVFAERGYKSATVRQICQAAEANVAAVNYYFGDKEQLYLETVKQAHRRLTAQFPLPPWPKETEPAIKLNGFVSAMLARMIGGKAMPWEQQLMLREVLHPTNACRELVEEYFRPQLELLLSILSELLPSATPTHKQRQCAFSIIGQCLFYRIAGDIVEMMATKDDQSHFSIEQLADHITKFSLAAISETSTSEDHDSNAHPSTSLARP